MYEYKNKKIELISVFPYKENNNWFFRLIYEVENTENGEVKNIIIPKCTNPFSEKCLSLDVKEDRWPDDPNLYYAFLDKDLSLPTPRTNCHLINEYCKLPVVPAQDDSIKGPHPYYYGEVIIKPATKEMTLEDIEKELGYNIKLKGTEKDD